MQPQFKLKIGGHTFEVIKKDFGKDSLDLAETDFDARTISIHSKSARSIQESALIHEILHVMNPTMNTSDDGHRILESLSEQLYQVVSDNLLINFDSVLGRDN